MRKCKTVNVTSQNFKIFLKVVHKGLYGGHHTYTGRLQYWTRDKVSTVCEQRINTKKFRHE